jgi:hypothetical protein
VNETGTYSLKGNTATLYAGTTTIGTAVLSGNTLTVKLNDASGSAGTYTFTRSGGNDSGNNNNGSITGIYTAMIEGYSATLIVAANSWVQSIPGLNIYMTGTYSLNGNTATLYAGGTIFGTAVLSGNTLIVTPSAASGYGGTTYYFTKSGGNDNGGTESGWAESGGAETPRGTG